MKKSILEEVQDYVVEQLMLDDELSGVTFLAESRKDLDYEVKSHLGRQGIVGIVMTPKVTYAGKKEDMYLAWTLEELEVDVIENVTVNRGQDNFTTGQAAAMRAIEWLCPTEGQQEGQFNPVSVEEGEESGLLVSRAVMKALVYGDPQDRKISMQFIKLLDSPLPEGATPRDGWMWPDGQGGYILWQDGEGHQIGGGGSGGGVTPQQMSAYVDSAISGKADLADLSNYLPLSGDEDANVLVNQLSSNLVFVGEPQYDGIHEGVMLYENGISLQKSKHTSTTNYYRTDIAGDGTIEQYSKSGAEDPVVYGTLKLPRNADGFSRTLATIEDIEDAVSAKADVQALSNYLPLSGGNMRGPIQMGSDFGNRLYFENHSIVYNSPDDIGFYTDNNTRGVFLDIHRALPISSGTPDYIAYRRDIDNAVSSKADVSMLNGYLPLSGNSSAKVKVDQLSAAQMTLNNDVWGNLTVNGCIAKSTKTEGDVRSEMYYDVSEGKWYGTLVDTAQFQVSALQELYLPKKLFTSEAPSATIATEEWTENKLSGYVQNLGGVNGILSASLDSWPSISASADPSTLYILVEGA